MRSTPVARDNVVPTAMTAVARRRPVPASVRPTSAATGPTAGPRLGGTGARRPTCRGAGSSRSPAPSAACAVDRPVSSSRRRLGRASRRARAAGASGALLQSARRRRRVRRRPRVDLVGWDVGLVSGADRPRRCGGPRASRARSRRRSVWRGVRVWAPRRLLPRHKVRPHHTQQDDAAPTDSAMATAEVESERTVSWPPARTRFPLGALERHVDLEVTRGPRRHVDVDGVGGVVERAQRREARPAGRALHLGALQMAPGAWVRRHGEPELVAREPHDDRHRVRGVAQHA